MYIQTVDVTKYYYIGDIQTSFYSSVTPAYCCGATQFMKVKWFLDYLRGFGLFFDTKESIPEKDLEDCAKNSDIDLIKIKEYFLYLRKKNNNKWPDKTVQGSHKIYFYDGEKHKRYYFESTTDFVSLTGKNTQLLKDILAVYYYRHQICGCIQKISSYLEEDKTLILILNTESQKIDTGLLPYIRYETENIQNGGYPDHEPLLKLYILSKNPEDVKLVKQYV
jgi:hypothetical protein